MKRIKVPELENHFNGGKMGKKKKNLLIFGVTVEPKFIWKIKRKEEMKQAHSTRLSSACSLLKESGGSAWKC